MRRKTRDAVEILRHVVLKNDPERLARVQAHQEAMEIAQQIYDLRTAAGLTQRQLAQLVGTSQSAIARLEDADYEGHSLAMLRRIAAALGQRVEIRFVPLGVEPERTATAGTLLQFPVPSGARSIMLEDVKRVEDEA